MQSDSSRRQPEFTSQAIRDLENIEEYISQDDPLAARRLVLRLRDVCFTLANQPFMGRARPELSPEIRSFTVGNYLILYRPLENNVEVVHVVHGSRNIHRLFE